MPTRDPPPGHHPHLRRRAGRELLRFRGRVRGGVVVGGGGLTSANHSGRLPRTMASTISRPASHHQHQSVLSVQPNPPFLRPGQALNPTQPNPHINPRYLAVWNLIVLTEGQHIKIYVEAARALKGAAEAGPGGGQARQEVKADLAELYIQAGQIAACFEAMVRRGLCVCFTPPLSLSHPLFFKLPPQVRKIGSDTSAVVDIPPTWKRISRIFESE